MKLKYIGSVINLGNSFSQATRPKHVGQMSELIQKFRDESVDHDVTAWESFYDEKVGSEKIQDASKKIWQCVQQIKENLNQLTEEDVYEWTKDLIIDKTHSGLQIQLNVLKKISNGLPYRLATTEEESQGIDGYVGDEAVSIKPKTYMNHPASNIEKIPHRIVYYTNGNAGLKVYE